MLWLPSSVLKRQMLVYTSWSKSGALRQWPAAAALLLLLLLNRLLSLLASSSILAELNA
jgi:hypothetical protein